MWKKIVCSFIILCFIITTVGCGGAPTVPPISPEPESSSSEEFVLVQVKDPGSNIIFVTGKENEDAIAILGEKDIEGNPINITEAVYVLEKGNSFGIEAGIDGLPTCAIDSEGNKVIFKNYTNSTVDVSIYDSNGDLIQGLTTINIDPVDLLELKQLYNSFYSKQRWSMKNTADALKWGAVGLSWTGCAISTAVSTATVAATVGIAIIACGNAMTSTIAAITPDDTDNMISTAAGTASCLGIGGLGCASTILGVVNLGIEAAGDNDTEIPEPTEAIFRWGNLVLGGISCHLVWKDNSDNEAGFLIQRMTTVYNPWSEVPDHTPFVTIARPRPNVTKHTDIAPLAAYVLEYRVAAIAADGRLSEWTTFSAVVMERPTELQAEVSGSPLHVKLSWNDNSRNELGFRIYRWTGIGDEGPWLEQSDTEWPLLDTVGANGETFTDVKVKSGYTHRYFVVAFNDDESSLPSNVETVFIPSQQPTADFTFKLSGLTVNFTDTSTDPDNNIVSWYWDFSDDKTSDTQNPIHTYLKAGTYDVILTVTDTAGFISTKTQTITVCTAPGSFTLNATPECDGTTSQIKLNWANSSGASSYDVYRNNILYYSGLTGTQFINSGNITVGTTYSYYIVAKNSCGSTASNTVSATAISCVSTNPVPPTGFSVSSYWNTASPGFPSMALSWNAVSGATGYEMWVRPSGGSYASLGTRDAPYVTFNSNSLPGGARYVSGTIYYFKIRTVTASSTSDFTSEVSCVAAAAPSSSLGQVQLSSPGNGITLPPGNITFSWNSVSNATKYQFILYNPLGQVALDTTKSSTSLIVALGTEETITWKVRAGDNNGNWGAWSSTWSLTLKSTTTIKSDLIVSNIWTEPNPPIAAGFTTIGLEIKNQGNADAIGTFFLEFYFDGTYQGHVYINGLTAGSTNTSYWQAVTWPSDTNLHTIKGIVDPDNTIIESDESNNQYSIQVKATEPPIGTGTLKIESVPGSAKVYIDGVYKGETPSSGYLTISDLTAGDHDLKLTKSGYKDWIGVVTIPSGATKYKAVILEPITLPPPIPLSPGTTSAPGSTISTLTPTLQWQGVSGADYYRFSISIYPYGTSNIIYTSSNLSTTSFILPSGKLSNGNKYKWNMRAFTNAGVSSEYSSDLYFQTEPLPTTQIERITNSSFSSGTSGWTLVGDFWAGTNLPNYHTLPGYAAGGVNSAGLPINNAAGWMYQTVTIPSGATSATLSFWYNITSYNPGPNKVDFLTVYVSDSEGNWLEWIIYSNLNSTDLGDYKKKTFDLTPHKGKTVTIKFLATSDYSNTTTFRIDDVSLMSDG